MRVLRTLLAVVALLAPLGAGCLSPALAAATCPMAGCSEGVSAGCCCAQRPAPAPGARDDARGTAPPVQGLSASMGAPSPPPASALAAGHRLQSLVAAPPVPLYLLHATFLV
jgi:hypothetical protein